MSIKIGIIGSGAIGKTHVKAAGRAGVKVLAFSDVDENIAKATAAEFDVPNAFGNHKDLLAMQELDAVVVATPNKFHAPLAIDSLNAGKDVLLEKPMALNVKECDKIIAAAKKNKCILQMGFMQRYTATSKTAKAYIDAGRLGNIYHAKANYYRRRGIPGLGGWFTTKDISGGGPLIDIGVHVLDLSMYLMNSPKPTRVSGKVYSNFGVKMKKYCYEGMWAGPPRFKGVCDVEDAAHALIRFEGGATLELNATWAGNFPDNSVQNLLGYFGDKGGITFELGGKELRMATEDKGHNVDIIPKLREADPFADEHKDFAKNVKKRTQPHADGQAGRLVQSIIDAIYDSSEKDREVEL